MGHKVSYGSDSNKEEFECTSVKALRPCAGENDNQSPDSSIVPPLLSFSSMLPHTSRESTTMTGSIKGLTTAKMDGRRKAGKKEVGRGKRQIWHRLFLPKIFSM